ncbi:hypothetical protein F0562_018251 [Nyssa sinensis]|uniref:Uncharacterized protein n=1 Tax=Nyssa sinensis TaxID=561372 RepID=A0A5J4ZB27_9ASTE|nr:hypothetical protein F0562_018251 [Nyssa sinensis]
MKPPPPSAHTKFFSSLKQVEKRLKLENPPQSSNLSSPPLLPLRLSESNHTSTESLSTPIYLGLDQPTNNNSSTLQDSEPPREFLSNSPDFTPTHEDPPQPNTVRNPQQIDGVENNAVDDIELLIQLLGLSDCKEDEQQRVGLGLKSGGSGGRACGPDAEFYAKIVGVKGPKCEKEVERLEGWIKHFLNDGGEGRREPLRLAHLLLGKAAFVSEGSDGFGGCEFPSTVEEFLQSDPPID